MSFIPFLCSYHRPIRTRVVYHGTRPRLCHAVMPLGLLHSSILFHEAGFHRLLLSIHSLSTIHWSHPFWYVSVADLGLTCLMDPLSHFQSCSFLPTGALKASLADFFAQYMSFKASSISPQDSENNDASSSELSRRMPVSFKRNLALLCYGGCYQGCGQDIIYNKLFTALFGAGTHLRTATIKVVFDMLMVQPFLCLPIAYVIKAPIFGYSVSESLRKYLRDVRHGRLLQTCWLVWTPAQMLCFTVIPTHLRISFIACISFFWLILFSTISASPSDSKHEGTFCETK